jgi:CheY-like chemotaxis protein
VASILIVDDEPANRLLVKTVLEHAGHSVCEAADAAEGLRLARDLAPDLTMIDLSLPGTSGVEFIQALRRDPQTESLQIALYTGSTVDSPMRDFMRLNGIKHVIPKPCEPQDLINAIGAMVN